MCWVLTIFQVQVLNTLHAIYQTWANFFIKGRLVNIVGFVGHTVSITTTQCKSSRIWYINKWAWLCFNITLLLTQICFFFAGDLSLYFFKFIFQLQSIFSLFRKNAPMSIIAQASLCICVSQGQIWRSEIAVSEFMHILMVTA